MSTPDLETNPETGTSGILSGEAIESVAFLARSEHRIRVLDLLDDGARTRDQLGAHLDVTRVTLSRILGDLEDRDLITRDAVENAYSLTTFGELVYRDFARLLGTVSVGRAYPDIVRRLPTEWFDFDLRCLATGDRVGGEDADPLSGARVLANAIRRSSSYRSLLGIFTLVPMYTIEEAIRTGDEPDGTVILDASVTETMRTDPELRDRWRKIEAATSGTLYYSVSERVPCSIDLVDDEIVFLTVDQEQDSGFDIVRSTHPEVLEWARTVIDEYRATATPLVERAGDEDA